MNLRTITVMASVVALAVPVVAVAGGSRTPVRNHATTSDSVLADADVASPGSAVLRGQLVHTKRRITMLRAHLRTAQVEAARIQAELRATRQLATILRGDLAAVVAEGAARPPTAAPAPAVVDTCRSSMVDCTPRELCEQWGLDCWLLEQAAAAAV